MKKFTLFLIHLIFLSVVSFSQIYSQNNLQENQTQQQNNHQGLYMKLDYLSIDLSDMSSFQNDLEAVIMPLQEARVNSGALKFWYLYKVLYPGSQNTEHNFVTVSICNAICAFEDIPLDISDQFSESELNELMERYDEVIVPKFSELWRINNSVLRTDNSKPARYFMLDYMRVKPGSEYTYQMMEDENARPIHEYRMENGNMEGWELFHLILPRGDEYGYNFATGNYYNRLRDLEFHFNEEVLRQSRPDVNVAEFFENVESIRDLVRSEVLELVDYVN